MNDGWVEIPVDSDFKKEADEALANLKTFDPVFNGTALDEVFGFTSRQLSDAMFEKSLVAAVMGKNFRSRKRAVEAFAKYSGKSMHYARKMIPPRRVIA